MSYTPVSILTDIKMPVRACPAHFTSGQFNYWGSSLPEIESVDLTVALDADIDIEELEGLPEDEIARMLLDAEWEDDLDDKYIKAALQNACENLISDSVMDYDEENGDGNDGMIMLDLNCDESDITHSKVMTNKCVPEEVESAIAEVGDKIVSDYIFHVLDWPIDAYYDMATGEILDESPMAPRK